MPDLPHSEELNIGALAGSFNNVTNSYKFYWLLAILEHVFEFYKPTIPMRELSVDIVSMVWYPTNYYHLSFGKQDKLSLAVTGLIAETGLSADANKNEVRAAFTQLSDDSKARNRIDQRLRYVPYRFLRPFFETELRGLVDAKVDSEIRTLANKWFDSNAPAPYRFVDDQIELHPKWLDYLTEHLEIIRGFCLWHLLQFLQRRNPNVPSVPFKLFAPTERDLGIAKKFWKIAISRIGDIECIYSGEKVDVSTMSLDHFLPWSFVTHDLLWNIVPTIPTVNSSKGNKLPNLQVYFERFASLQGRAVAALCESNNSKLLEDYLVLLKTDQQRLIDQLDTGEFVKILKDTLYPQAQLARNMGFVYDWQYAG